MKNVIKTIEKGQKEFNANGKKFTILDKISPEKFKVYEQLVPELTFGLGFSQIYASLQKLYAMLNKQEFANSAVVCHNIMNGIKTIDDPKRIHPALKMAALMIVREDEDPRIYDETIMLDKINDWQEEGMDMMGFFELSLTSIQGFKQALIDCTKKNLSEINTELQQS